MKRKLREKSNPLPKSPIVPLKILLVDDDQFICKTVAQSLSLVGHTVFIAENGAEALMVFEREKPDVSLIDIHLPDLDGFGVLKTLRRKYPTSELIFITGEGDMNLVIQAFRDGISDFVPKPLSIEILMTILENATRRIEEKTDGRKETEKSKNVPTTETDIPVLIRAFGGLSMSLNGKFFLEKDWQNFKTLAVFKLLLIRHKKIVPIDDLVEAIWKDVAYRSAEVMVFTAISFIRRLFEPNLKNGRNSKFVLNHELGYELNLGEFGKDYYFDAEDFGNIIREARRSQNFKLYHKAVELHSDDFLKNNLADEWSREAREQLRDDFLFALQTIAEESFQHKRFDETIQAARKMLAADSLYEPAYTFLIESYLALRRNADARRVLVQCQAIFKKMLNEPAPKHIQELLK